MVEQEITLTQQFLLTHPVWDVTTFYSPNFLIFRISTHTSRVGCDFIMNPTEATLLAFLLTHPVWDVTILLVIMFIHLLISTHTSRVGCD